jgi:hypothetical protein
VPETDSYLKCACQKCGGHIEFPLSGFGASIVCPHCGGSTLLSSLPPGPPRRKKSLIWVAVVILGLGAIGAAWLRFGRQYFPPTASETSVQKQTAPTVRTPAVQAPPPDPWHGLKAGSVMLQKAENGDLVYAVGALRNESGRERFGVKVEVDVFDAQDKKLGFATDYTQSIIPGKEWRFKALVIDRKAVRAAMAKVTEQE